MPHTDYDSAPWPDTPVTKAQVEAWESTATKAEQHAAGNFATEYRDWLTTVQNEPEVLWEWKGKVRELAKKHQVPWPVPACYNTDPAHYGGY